jgi:hypothetical protein
VVENKKNKHIRLAKFLLNKMLRIDLINKKNINQTPIKDKKYIYICIMY